MKLLPEILERNRAWAERQVGSDPEYFQRLTKIQSPEYLWIGCSDSRVPANQIVDLSPGQLFVQRNVANIVAAEDTNCMAVLEYALATLGVRHVIVCGHYGCGGVRAALDGTAVGVVGAWLQPLRDLALQEQEALAREPDDAARWHLLCELNVAEQIRRLSATEPVRRVRATGERLTLHGWIYDLRDGLLRDLEVGDS